MEYRFVYRNATYIFTGDLYEFVVGETDRLPEHYSDEWKYMARFARQRLDRKRKSEHRARMKKKLKIVK